MRPLSVLACGMMTSVGLNAPAACAAIRAGLTNFAETRFMGRDGEWIVGAEVPLDPPWRGRAKLVHMVAPAIRECLDAVGSVDLEKMPLLLCVSEKDRPGRFAGIEEHLLAEVQEALGMTFHPDSAVISRGRVGGVSAVQKAETLIYEQHVRSCIVAGTDTYLTAGTLSSFEQDLRLLTTENSDGFLPGEAGAAVLLGPEAQSSSGIHITGIGFGTEPAPITSEEPLRADGLTEAIKNALTSARLKMGDLDFRICDLSGEQYGFKEAALALSRTLRERKEFFDIWLLAESLGETGAAVLPAILGVAGAAFQKEYALGDNVLCHFGNDDGSRGAIILQHT